MTPKSAEQMRPKPAAADTAQATASKVVSIDVLAGIVKDARQSGRKVVLCHGVFDVVHLGHIRHLQAARAEGDVLVVTTTADAFVNKGPGRPVFPEHLRAEMLAALEIVDWVAVNHHPSSVPVIEAIKPDIYVKGSEYQNAEDDVTGRIHHEKDAVEAHGGKIVFTHDITFSSSNLINRYLDVHDPALRDFLSAATAGGAYARIADLIKKVENYKVVLVGDTIIDEYVYVSALGKPSKEHIVATLYCDRELFAGGVIATANHVAGFCNEVEVVTMLGGDEAHEELVREQLRPNVKLHAIHVPGRPTTRKTRFIDTFRKLFEVYTMDDTPLEASQREQVNQAVRERCATADVTIVNDFGHGLIDKSTVDVLARTAKFLAVNVQTNSGNQGFNTATKYPRASYVCVDAPEARLAVSDKFNDINQVIVDGLAKRIDCKNFMVTHGELGCYAYSEKGKPVHVPAFTKSVVDTMGAGDALFAVTSPLVAAGGSMEDIAIVGNATGAIKVGIVGHRNFVDRPPQLKYLAALLK